MIIIIFIMIYNKKNYIETIEFTQGKAANGDH